MSRASVARDNVVNNRKSENKPLTPDNIQYYTQRVDSPSFIQKKKAVIAGLTAQYWMNKALSQNQKK